MVFRLPDRSPHPDLPGQEREAVHPGFLCPGQYLDHSHQADQVLLTFWTAVNFSGMCTQKPCLTPMQTASTTILNCPRRHALYTATG